MARAKARSETTLYERDFSLWLKRQAQLLRERRLDELDVPNLLEEVEDMGRSEKKAIKNNLDVILLHLLKHQFQATRRSRSWLGSIVEHRQRLHDDLNDSPSLRGHLEAVFARAYADARTRAIVETGLPESRFPETSPYSLEQALDPKFRPG